MSEEIVVVEDEAKEIGLTLARNYRDSLQYYRTMHREVSGLTHKEANEKAQADVDATRSPEEWLLERIAETPANELSWHDLEVLENQQEGQASQCWQQIKDAARQELVTGQRGAEVVLDCLGTPFERARYAVLREELAKEWQPRNGIEWALIEQMTQMQTMYFHWLSVAHGRVMRIYRGLAKGEARYQAPRVSEQACQEFAADMAERYHKLFLRSLRALQNMRRYAPVVVQNAGQVNVGAQQVNLAQAAEKEAQTTLPASEESRSVVADSSGGQADA
jgi:hypothetical protein